MALNENAKQLFVRVCYTFASETALIFRLTIDYQVYDFVINVLKWMENSNHEFAVFLRSLRTLHSFSEKLMAAAFAMNSFLQVTVS